MKTNPDNTNLNTYLCLTYKNQLTYTVRKQIYDKLCTKDEIDLFCLTFYKEVAVTIIPCVLRITGTRVHVIYMNLH